MVRVIDDELDGIVNVQYEDGVTDERKRIRDFVESSCKMYEALKAEHGKQRRPDLEFLNSNIVEAHKDILKFIDKEGEE